MQLHRRNVSQTAWQDPEQPEPGDRDRFHVAINMDGNGRWALLRGQPREAGHVAGGSAVRRTVEAAPALGITTLTLYAFSSDNWRRPRGEVDNLMSLFQQYLDSECARLMRVACVSVSSGAGTESRILFVAASRTSRRVRARDRSSSQDCDRLFGPRGVAGGSRPPRQWDPPHPRSLRAIHV